MFWALNTNAYRGAIFQNNKQKKPLTVLTSLNYCISRFRPSNVVGVAPAPSSRWNYLATALPPISRLHRTWSSAILLSFINKRYVSKQPYYFSRFSRWFSLHSWKGKLATKPHQWNTSGSNPSYSFLHHLLALSLKKKRATLISTPKGSWTMGTESIGLRRTTNLMTIIWILFLELWTTFWKKKTLWGNLASTQRGHFWSRFSTYSQMADAKKVYARKWEICFSDGLATDVLRTQLTVGLLRSQMSLPNLLRRFTDLSKTWRSGWDPLKIPGPTLRTCSPKQTITLSLSTTWITSQDFDDRRKLPLYLYMKPRDHKEAYLDTFTWSDIRV